jgi:hypothetical protein
MLKMVYSTISFANLGLIYISITPKSGVKGNFSGTVGRLSMLAQAKLGLAMVGAPELC